MFLICFSESIPLLNIVEDMTLINLDNRYCIKRLQVCNLLKTLIIEVEKKTFNNFYQISLGFIKHLIFIWLLNSLYG